MAVAFNAFVSHLECSETGEQYPANQTYNVSKAGYPLLVRYDLKALKDALEPRALSPGLPGFWRYSKLLPLGPLEQIVSLGEVCTPLIPLPIDATAHRAGLAAKFGSKTRAFYRPGPSRPGGEPRSQHGQATWYSKDGHSNQWQCGGGPSRLWCPGRARDFVLLPARYPAHQR